MPKLPPGELSLHSTKGYRMTCGTYIGTDGKRRPKVFWLGRDKDAALLEAAKIRWAAPIAAAMSGGWTKEYEETVRATDSLALVRQRIYEGEQIRLTLAPHIPAQVIVQMPQAQPAALPSSKATVQPATPAQPMFYDALDAYVASLKQRPISPSHKTSSRDSLVAIKHYQSDCPLKEIDYAWLERLTNLIKSRPLSRKKDSRAGEYLPIKPHTVHRLLANLRQAIHWVGKQYQSAQFGGWRPPSEWQEICSVKMSSIMTKVERDRAADGPEQLTMNELAKIYRAARQSREQLHPILFLMGLFAGLGQTELSTLRRDEIDLENATCIHRRNKTSQKGEYWLPPELVAQLRAYFDKQKVKSDDLAFRTRKGQPLVTETSDSVRQAWADWRQRSEVYHPGLGFYALRRFFGDFATRFGGESVGDAALAHTAKSVRGKHYSGYRPFDKVKEAGQKLHSELTAAGMFKEPMQEAVS